MDTLQRESAYNTYKNSRILLYGEVVSVEDPLGLGRIQVRVKGTANTGGDDNIENKDLPWCLPLMPKHFSIQPKVNESVIIFTFATDKQHVDRLYMGPIISQPHKLNFDSHFGSALAGFTFGHLGPSVNVNNVPEIDGVFPKQEDVSIEGRYNTDIIQKNNEVLIRAGKFVESPTSSENPYPFKFNTVTQGFIQVKGKFYERGSITNIVSNKINLLTHDEGFPRFNLTNQIDLIDDEELEKIMGPESEGGAHRLPFGDILLQYLRLLKDALYFHVHNGNGSQATDLTTSGNKQALAAFKARAEELENKMLSNNVRIN
jgi:hypothetical protein